MGNKISPSTSSKQPSVKSSGLQLSTSGESRTSSEVRPTSPVSGEQSTKNKELSNPNNKYIPGLFDVWALGVNTVLGGTFYGWNQGLLAGFGSYCIGQTLVGFAYINLAMCLAEICSTISFSGGAYGMTRVVLGFYIGFIVAAFELMEYVSYISAAALFIAGFVCEELGWDEQFTPLICFVFYVGMILLVLDGNQVFWRVNAVAAIGIVAIMLIYIFGSLPYMNFDRYARLNGDDDGNVEESGEMKYWFAGGMVAFLRAMPLMTWGFGGIESIALVTDIIENPRRNLSYGITAAVMTLFVLMMCVLFVGCALPPGARAFAEMDYYMDAGFVLMGMSRTAAHWLILPAQFAMAGGFFVPAAKLYHAISESHLVPKFLQVHRMMHESGAVQQEEASTTMSGKSIRESVVNQHHQWAVIYVSIASFLLCLVGFYVPNFEMDSIPILLAQFTYLSDLYAYFQLKITFHNPKDEIQFRNPFGVWGAILSALLFALCAVGIILYQSTTYLELIFAVSYGAVLSIYYFAYAKHVQIFSEEEQKKLLILHVITNNKRKRAAKNAASKKSSRVLLSSFFTSGKQGGSMHGSGKSKQRGMSFAAKNNSVHSQATSARPENQVHETSSSHPGGGKGVASNDVIATAMAAAVAAVDGDPGSVHAL